MKRAIAYVRRSKKSDETTVSIEQQKAVLTRYADEHEIEIVTTVTHDGISGTKRKRFDVIEKEVQQFKPDVILVYHLDRFGRDSVGVMSYLTDLYRRGISVIEVAGAGRVKIEKAADFLSTGIRSQVDQFFAMLVSEKTRDALSHLKSVGKVYSRTPPFGYSHVNGKLVQNPNESVALGIIRDCALQDIGARRTIVELEKAGYRGRRSVGLVHKLLRQSR